MTTTIMNDLDDFDFEKLWGELPEQFTEREFLCYLFALNELSNQQSPMRANIILNLMLDLGLVKYKNVDGFDIAKNTKMAPTMDNNMSPLLEKLSI